MLLCYVTDRRLIHEAASPDDLLQRVECSAEAGIDWIQIREKDLSACELVDFTRRAIAATHREDARNRKIRAPQIIVNDRIDVALAAGAAGVHLGEKSVPPFEAVRWLLAGNAPPNFLVGVSCHNLDEASAAEKAGANYIFFGPVYETPAKLRFGQPQGTEKLGEVCRRVRIPVLAIGGITEANAAACLRAGASGIAAIRMFQAGDPATLEGVIARLRISE